MALVFLSALNNTNKKLKQPTLHSLNKLTAAATLTLQYTQYTVAPSLRRGCVSDILTTLIPHTFRKVGILN